MLTFRTSDDIKKKNLDVKSDISALLNSFERDQEGTLREIYSEYRDSFLEFGRAYTQDDEVAIDCFQEAVISLYENLAIGRVTDQNTTVKTYLYAIGKYKILNAQRKNKNQLKVDFQSMESKIEEGQNESKDRASILDRAMDQLGERCQEVLVKFYYQRYSIEAIMHSMNYKNENTVKAHKSRCLAQLKDFLKHSNTGS